MIQLDGKVVLVTGAGRGIGRLLAEAMAGAGGRLVLVARTEAELADAAATISGSGGATPMIHRVDVGDADGVAELGSTVREAYGRLDVLVNNAAALGPVGELTSVDLADWAATLMANVASVARVTATLVPLMPEGGRIINMAGGGVGGPKMSPRLSAYTVSKAAVVALTETLAGELEPRGISVNAVSPGYFPTGFMSPVIEAGPAGAGDELYETTVRQEGEAPDEARLLDLVLYLAGGDSRWLTGRLLSARWDSPETLTRQREQMRTSSLYTMRRIDGDLYSERDR